MGGSYLVHEYSYIIRAHASANGKDAIHEVKSTGITISNQIVCCKPVSNIGVTVALLWLDIYCVDKTVTIAFFHINSSLQNDFWLYALSVVVACLPYVVEDGGEQERNFVGAEPSVASL